MSTYTLNWALVLHYIRSEYERLDEWKPGYITPTWHYEYLTIAFCTTDAPPFSKHWLMNLILFPTTQQTEGGPLAN